ncbi:MAG: argonaute/piwi family protein [Nitrosopumilaceae archaeon]
MVAIEQNTNTILNLLPISISGDTFTAYVSKFESKDSFEKLKRQFQNCLFHARGGNIYCVPLSEGKTYGNEVILEVASNFALVRKLIMETIQGKIIDTSRIFTYFPTSFIDTKKNLLDGISQYVDKLSWLRLYPEFSLNVKIIHLQNGQPLFGVVVDANAFYDVSENISTLMTRGLNPVGLYVIKKSFSRIRDKNRREKRLLGKIESISGSTLKLSDYRAQQTVDSSECHLEASKRNRILVVRSLFNKESEQVKNLLERQELQIADGEGKHGIIKLIADEISSLNDIVITKGLSFKVANDFLSLSNGEINTRKVTSPTFVYDPARKNTDTWHNRGLNSFGPFDSEVFLHKEPKLVVITPDVYKGEVEKFINAFKSGTNGRGYYQLGFVRKYHFTKMDTIDFRIVKYSSANIPTAYREACLSALENGTYDLAIVIIEEKFHEKRGDNDPYLVSKSVFMSQGIPVQEIEIETIRQGESSWPYTLDNIALACYVKMGGTPWTLSTYEPIYHELVIGMGNAIIKDGRLGGSTRYVGITNVFSADGSYLLNNISTEIVMENYKVELLKSLKTLIEHVSNRNAWQKGDNVRLIFHQQFKNFKNEDIEAIKEFIEGYKDYKIEFSFVHLSQNHNFQIYDKNQTGVAHQYDKIYANRGLMKGKFAPERGWGVQTGNRDMLLTLTGPKQIVTPLHGIPKPLYISIHKDSTFLDIHYIARQIFQFTFLNWRGFNPTSIPVTILYSDLIAHLMGKLSIVSNWNSDILRTKLKYSRWFL